MVYPFVRNVGYACLAHVLTLMAKLSFSRPWESTIAVLEDNIFSNDSERWQSAISSLTVGQNSNSVNFFADRRKEPRFSLSLPVNHRVKGLKLKWHHARSVDVSQNGIRLALDKAVRIGTRLELNIKLPNLQNKIKLEGVVIWGKPSLNGSPLFECGVAFENLRNISKKERLVHFMADRLCAIALEQSQDLSCRIASSAEDLLKAYRLVYREYVVRGYCKPNPFEINFNAFCMLPGTRTFLLEKNKEVIGTISLIPDSPCLLPMGSLFEDKISTFRKPGRRLAEIGLLALDHQIFGRKSFALTDFKKLAGSFKLFKIMFDYARFEGKYSDLFIAMHPKHKDLYHYLTFDTIGPVRGYPGAEGNPALPMHMDVARTINTVPRHMSICRYFIETLLDPDMLKAPALWNRESLHRFLKDFHLQWNDLKPEQQEYLKICYPEILFDL